MATFHRSRLRERKEGRFDVHPAAVNRVGAAAGNAGVRQAAGDGTYLESDLGSAREEEITYFVLGASRKAVNHDRIARNDWK